MGRVARAAARQHVSLEIAVALMLERSLTVEELTALDPSLPAILDVHATAARTNGALSGAASVYLRQLTGGAGQLLPAAGPLAGPLMIPVRVATRVQRARDERIVGLLEGDLARSVAWERAALLENRTIAEWASWQALRLLSR
jgi:hypothetical protein